jgi:M6 family metalloprotease-like protein
VSGLRYPGSGEARGRRVVHGGAFVLSVLFALAVGGLWVASHPSIASATQAAPDAVVTVVQPDGSPLVVIVWGDEFAAGYETMDGYTVVQDADGWWVYAVVGVDGQLAPSSAVAGSDAPPGPQHVRPDQAVVDAARAAMMPTVDGGAMPAGAPPWAGPDTNVLIVMVQFTDVTFSYPNSSLDSVMFGDGATGPGNLADYFWRVSDGLLGLNGTVVGPVTASHSKSYYDTFDGNYGGARLLVTEAVALADPLVDYSAFDNDGNGRVDDLIVVYAGGGAHDGCYTETTQHNLWPHSGSLTSPASTSDGVTVSPHILNSGVTYGLNDHVCDEVQTIGLIVHEFGHALGLRDLYDTGTTNTSEGGVGNWSSMASQYLGGTNLADSPAFYDPYSRSYLGWLTPTDHTATNASVSLPRSETSATALRLLANPNGVEVGGTGEYFLVENRGQTDFDLHLPGCGVLIWHVDETRTTNQVEGYRLVQLLQADGLGELDAVPRSNDRGDAGDPYPGSTVNRLFSDSTTPNAHLNSGAASGVRVGIPGSCGASMTVDLGTPVSGPVSYPAVIRGGVWFLRESNTATPGTVTSFAYGLATDTPVFGDWDGDGVKTPGLVRVTGGSLTWYLRNANSAGSPDLSFSWGAASDRPLVGDWDGNGTDTIGILRGNWWILRNSNSAGAPDASFFWGIATDVPLVGDWNGDGADSAGWLRCLGAGCTSGHGNWFILRNALSDGPPDLDFFWGRTYEEDAWVVGDWDGDGTDDPGILRDEWWLLRTSLSDGPPTSDFFFGLPTDTFRVWAE